MNDCVNNALREQLKMRNIFYSIVYSDIRHDFTTEINSVCPPDSGDEDKIISLFSSRTLIIKTAHFILDALKIRVS